MEGKAENHGTKRGWNHSAEVSSVQSLEEINLEMDLTRHLARSLSQLREQANAKYALDVALLQEQHVDRAECARERLRSKQLHRQALLADAILNSESLATAASFKRDLQAPENRGVGCDAQLPPRSVSKTGKRPPFAQAWNSVAHEPRWHTSFCQPIEAQVFGGTSAFSELCEAIAVSGLEPLQYLDNVMLGSGINWKADLAVELNQMFYALFSLATTDLLDMKHSSMAEHMSRRILQIQGALASASNVGGLDAYTRHGAVCHGTVFAPKFRADMAGIMREECLYLKQLRVAREEAEAEMKKPTTEKCGGCGGGGGGGDSKGGGESDSGGDDNQGASASSGK